MRIFKTRLFMRWATKEGLTDKILYDAVQEMNTGLIDADLGGNVYKKRVSIKGRGKRGAFRTVLAFRIEERAFYLYGFAKNKRSNIGVKELKALRFLAQKYLEYSNEELNKAIKSNAMIEVCTNG